MRVPYKSNLNAVHAPHFHEQGNREKTQVCVKQIRKKYADLLEISVYQCFSQHKNWICVLVCDLYLMAYHRPAHITLKTQAKTHFNSMTRSILPYFSTCQQDRHLYLLAGKNTPHRAWMAGMSSGQMLRMTQGQIVGKSSHYTLRTRKEYTKA